MKTRVALSVLPLLVPFLLMAQPKEVIDAYNLNQAIVGNKMDELKKLIKEGSDVNYQYNGRSALHTACDKGYTEIAALLIKAGADVNAYSEEGAGRTPLQFAVGDPMQDFPELADLLLKSGADPDLALNPDQLPLFEAINQAHPESVKLLLDNDASRDIENSMDHNPLEQVNYLIDRGVTDPGREESLKKIQTIFGN